MTAFIQQPSRHRAVRAVGRLRLSLVAAAPAFPEHVLHAVHHAGRPADPGRPSAALLGARLHAGDRLVPLPGPGAEGPHLDRQGRFRHPADVARHSRPAPYPRAVALVAFLGQPAVADQRRRLLRAAVFHRPVAPAGAADLGGVPGRALDRDPVCLAELSGRSKAGPATTASSSSAISSPCSSPRRSRSPPA